MSNDKKKNKTIALAIAALFVMTGTYNAVVINSQSDLSTTENKFVKRLDEVYGITVAGRGLAGSVKWTKLSPSQVITKTAPLKKVEKSSVTASAVESIPAASVQEELTLSLVEVTNQKKWQNGLPSAQFNGSLTTNNGIIENLVVALPNGEGVSVSFSEMTGNVFEYDLGGEIYSGMMYQVDQSAYMVTLTNGPLEGTRMRFSSQSPAEEQIQTQELLAESNIEIGTFGSEPVEQMVQNEIPQTEAPVQGQGFNL